MNGDLSIAPPPALRDLALGAAGRVATARPGSQVGVATASAQTSLLRQEVALEAGERLAVGHLKTLLTDPAVRVSTHHDRSTGRTILQVQSRATGEVIEQIPSEALLQLYAAMRETLVDERA